MRDDWGLEPNGLGRALDDPARIPDEPERISDDPGRPDDIILGAPGSMLVIISGPSGVGKDTIIDVMREQEARTGRSGERHYVVTVTTRAPRDGEIDGIDYHFVTREEFLRIRAARGFLEANEVHGNWYGSPRDQVREALASGRDAILKIDVQGAQVVKEQVTRQDDYDHVVVNETGQAERTAERINAIIAEERRLHAHRRVRV